VEGIRGTLLQGFRRIDGPAYASRSTVAVPEA